MRSLEHGMQSIGSGDTATYSVVRFNLKKGIRCTKMAHKQKIKDHFTSHSPQHGYKSHIPAWSQPTAHTSHISQHGVGICFITQP